MTRRFILTVLVGVLAAWGVAAQDSKKKGGKTDSATIAKKLEGNWKLTRKEFKGNLFPSGFRKEGLFFEDDKIAWTEDGKALGQKGNFTIDTSTSPMSIDVEITAGNVGQKLLGIFEIKGEKLTICWGEPGGEKRPKKFVTKTVVGAGTTLEIYQSVDANQTAGDAKTEPKKNGGKDDAATVTKKLEGNWKLTRKEFKGNLFPSGFRKEGLFFEDGKISWTEDGKAIGQRGDVTIDTSTSPMSIDVEFTRGTYIGKKQPGIFEIKGDKLTICWGEPGGEKRPKKFVTKTAIGAGVWLETYQALDANKATAEAKGAEPKNGSGKGDAAAEAKKLEGNWKLTRHEFKGSLRPSGFRKEGLFFEDGKIFWTEDGKAVGQKGDFTIDAGVKPKAIDVEITRGSYIGKKLLGIYEIQGGKLTICWSEPGGEKRPKKFVTKTAVGAGTTLETYQKQKD